jgi:hypothetical protein
MLFCTLNYNSHKKAGVYKNSGAFRLLGEFGSAKSFVDPSPFRKPVKKFL